MTTTTRTSGAECKRFNSDRTLALVFAWLAAWPMRSDAQDQEDRKPVLLPIVVARHVMLFEGQQITTWPQIEERIAALPDPSLSQPQLFVTRGAREAGKEDAAQAEIWRLHQKYGLQGHSVGSLWPRSDLRYDRIDGPDDLQVDPSLQVAGTILDHHGNAVAGAEVILVTPIDESISYRTYHLELIRGRVRNRLEHVLSESDEAGRFWIYPPRDQNYRIVALHPDAGFALAESASRGANDQIKLSPWASLISKLDSEPGREQEAIIKTAIDARDDLPPIEVDQYWSEQKDDLPRNFYGFTHVPPGFDTTISRSFAEADGSSISVPGANVRLQPGDIRRLDLGPLSDEQREQYERIRRDLEQSRRPVLPGDAAEPDD